MAEWLKAAVLKTVDGNVRGFESYFLRHFFIGKGEMAESAEGARLLSECTPKSVPRVRIPLSPPLNPLNIMCAQK